MSTTQFIARNGFTSKDNSVVSGSLTVTNGITGSLYGTASWAYSASNAINAQTASYLNPLFQTVILTGSLLVTQSYISAIDYIDFTILTSASAPPHSQGRIHWLDDTKTLQIDTDVSGFMVEVGHQSVVRGRNRNSFTLTKGTIVYINGESGNRPTFATASWIGDPTSAATLGIVAQDIIANQTGYVVTNGMLRNINTNAYAPGTQLYLSSSGQYTSTKPQAPYHDVRIGKTIVQATDGTIYVDIMNGYELNEIHDVQINGVVTGDLLVRSGSLWINSKQLSGSYGLTGSLSATSFTGSLQGTASWATNALTASYVDLSQISAGNISASVSTDTNNLFLIKSGSTEYLKIGNNGDTTINSSLFIIKDFTTQSPVLTVSQSIVQFATQSSAPIGNALAGGIWFTSTDFYVGLE